MEGFYIAALQKTNGVGVVTLFKLIEHFGTAKAVWEASTDEILQASFLSITQKEAIINLRKSSPSLPEEIYSLCQDKGILLASIYDDNYPLILKEIQRPPIVLFYRGTLNPREMLVAIVGSRHATPYGKSVAELIALGLADNGVNVISGAALGIDTAAHIGALKKGRTIAVLGCGVDIAYPSQNRKMLDEIAEKGAVISEYMPGTKPQPAFFPARNRIISGMARGTIIVEAAAKSGSLITAELALSEGRDVFAVPGSIFSEQSQGTNALIKEGAKLIQGVDDILSEYSIVEKQREKENPKTEEIMSDDEREIYKLLSLENPISLDEIVYKLNGKNISNIAFILLQMELNGFVKETADHNYLKMVEEVRL